MELAPGNRLGRFLLERKLGKGSSGIVFLATDTLLGQPVALKVLHAWLVDDAEVRERFKREIVLTRRITSAGVCRLHDMHEDDGLTYITMEYVEGKTLTEIIHDDGRMTPTRTLQILRGTAAPLLAAHTAGVVHRDLKPGNIMVKTDGSVCVLDFGMATASNVTKITQAGRTVGSLRFIAPEVWQGDPAVPASDQYALGVVLYACMAGKLPYEAKTPLEAFEAQKKGPPSLLEHNAAVTPGVDAVVRQAMARKPGDRFADVAALLAAFEAAVAHEEATSSTGTVIVRPRDAQDPENVRLTPLVQAEGDVFTSTPARIPRPVLIAAGAVGALIAASIVAAIAVSPSASTSTPAPPEDARVDAGTRHLVERAPVDDDGPVELTPPDGAGRDDGAATAVHKGAPRDGAVRDGTVHDGAVRDAPSTSPSLNAARAAFAAAMKKRGLLPGDAPAVDALAAKAHKLEAKPADAAALLDRARDAAGKVAVDRGFITAKQKRLSFVVDKAPAASQGKLAALQAEVEKLVVARDYAGANERLNRAFALVK